MLGYLDTLIGFAVVMLVISLVITILTQVGSSLINHRGGNLLWGIKTLLANIDPGRFPQLREQAETVAREVLSHCLVSDSWFSDNVAARWFAHHIPGLRQLFARYQLASAIRPGELASILRHLADNRLAGTELAREIQSLLGTGSVRIAAGTPGPASILAAEVPRTNLEDWFDSMMDRVSAKFAMYMRIWTVGFACVFAFGTGLNCFQLLSDLYTNGAFRSALVGAGQQAMTTAGRVMDLRNSLAVRYAAALQQVLREVSAKPRSGPPSAIATPSEGVAWIEANLPLDQSAEVRKRFESATLAVSQAFVQSSLDDAAKVSAIASSAGFDVMQYRWPPNPSLRDVLGVIVTAALLSLGAPFWFNSLKYMTNLRPIVAAKEDDERRQAVTPVVGTRR